MIKIAIAGNIASGKSTVEKILIDKYKFSVLDTDKVCHSLLETLSDEIIKAFEGYDIIAPNGKLSRDKLGKIVFYHVKLKKILEDILYPNLKFEINNYFNLHKGEKFVFVAIPLLFEAKMENLFDKIIFVYCDDNIRIKRLISRNNYSEEYALQRINSQLSQDEKIKKSHIIIKNNSDLTALNEEIDKAIKQLQIF